MSIGQQITAWTITAVAVGLIVYDVWVCIKYGSASTISWVTWTTCRKYPIIPFAAGILCGHLFWVQQTGMTTPAQCNAVLHKLRSAVYHSEEARQKRTLPE